MFIEICKISKLVMHLNSFSMDLGLDICILRFWLMGSIEIVIFIYGILRFWLIFSLYLITGFLYMFMIL